MKKRPSYNFYPPLAITDKNIDLDFFIKQTSMINNATVAKDWLLDAYLWGLICWTSVLKVQHSIISNMPSLPCNKSNVPNEIMWKAPNELMWKVSAIKMRSCWKVLQLDFFEVSFEMGPQPAHHPSQKMDNIEHVPQLYHSHGTSLEDSKRRIDVIYINLVQCMTKQDSLFKVQTMLLNIDQFCMICLGSNAHNQGSGLFSKKTNYFNFRE